MNRRVLADVNLLFALAFEGSTQYSYAEEWLRGMMDGSVVVCRTAQSGLLRLLTNRSAMGGKAQTMTEAWQAHDRLMADIRFSFLPEPDGVEDIWRKLSVSRQVEPKKWSDAYLAAFAITAGIGFATFDRGFRDFPGLDLVLLGPAAVHETAARYELG